MKQLTGIIACAVAGAMLLGWRMASSEAQPVSQPALQTGKTHSITLPTIKTDLPAGPSRETVIARCEACHSQRYIFMQPRFSKEVWTAEVQKMKKTFGAPVADEQVEEIVAYLVSVRGNER